MSKVNFSELPSVLQLQEELSREKHKRKYNSAFRSTVNLLITIVAISALLAMFIFPVLQTYGHSMSPTLEDGEFVICLRTSKLQSKDIVAFYYNNKILIKRLIGLPGDMINIDDEGNVFVNGVMLDEPYVNEKSIGECDLEFPYQVPDGKYFFLGDHRSVSIDSRSSVIGCISEEQIVGKLFFKVWPLKNFSPIDHSN